MNLQAYPDEFRRCVKLVSPDPDQVTAHWRWVGEINGRGQPQFQGTAAFAYAWERVNGSRPYASVLYSGCSLGKLCVYPGHRVLLPYLKNDARPYVAAVRALREHYERALSKPLRAVR